MKPLYILISVSALLMLLTGCPFNDNKNNNPNVNNNNPNITYDAAFPRSTSAVQKTAQPVMMDSRIRTAPMSPSIKHGIPV